jgi:hypothetical protein
VKDEVPVQVRLEVIGGISYIGNESWWVGSCLNRILIFNF